MQYVLIKSPYSRKKIADGLNDQNRTNKNVFVISGFFKKKPLCLFLSAVIYLQLGSSLSPSTVTGACQLVGAVVPWRMILFFYSAFSRNSRLLLPHFFLYRCSFSRSPAFLRSRIPRRTVEGEYLRSAAMVGMAGQHALFSFVLSAR